MDQPEKYEKVMTHDLYYAGYSFIHSGISPKKVGKGKHPSYFAGDKDLEVVYDNEIGRFLNDVRGITQYLTS